VIGTENGKVKMENGKKSLLAAETQQGNGNVGALEEKWQRILSHNTWLTITGTPLPCFAKVLILKGL
jgi:hypothetical protein